MNPPERDADVIATIEFSSDIELIPMVRMMLRRALPQLSADESSLYFGAVTEVLANAVQAQEGQPDASVCVDISLHGWPMVVVRDEGPGFDVGVPVAALPDGDRGNGLVIAQSACPHMTIESGARGTNVSLPFGPRP